MSSFSVVVIFFSIKYNCLKLQMSLLDAADELFDAADELFDAGDSTTAGASYVKNTNAPHPTENASNSAVRKPFKSRHQRMISTSHSSTIPTIQDSGITAEPMNEHPHDEGSNVSDSSAKHHPQNSEGSNRSGGNLVSTGGHRELQPKVGKKTGALQAPNQRTVLTSSSISSSQYRKSGATTSTKKTSSSIDTTHAIKDFVKRLNSGSVAWVKKGDDQK